MALLQRTRVLPNQRLDLPDYQRIEDFVCADFKAITKNTLANQNFVFAGFIPTGIGTNTLHLPLAGSSFVVGQDDGATFIGAPSLSPLTSSALAPGATNYVEVFVDQDTGGADSRAFWDATANSGAGAEFSQIVDTFTFLKAELSISTSNFSGDSNKVKVAEVDVNGSGVITAIRDRRDLFYRLGRGTNTAFTFPWSSRTEPSTASFTGADKDIKTQKMMNDALMDSIREIKGTTHWFELAPVSLQASFRNAALSMLVGNTGGARFAWDGSALQISDDSGSPLTTDVISYLRLFDVINNIGLRRQDGVNAIPIANGQVLWVELPDPLANVQYHGIGATASNYRVTARGSVPLADTTYWLAYREGSKLYLRGMGELDAGESKEIEDSTSDALIKFLGFDPETATSVPYSIVPGGLVNHHFTTADTLVAAISANAGNINDIAAILNTNPYEEVKYVIAGIPSNTHEIQGPVSAGAFIPLPLDSRDSNSTEYYVVGRGSLQVFLNGQYIEQTDNWNEVGSPASLSSQIQIQRDLVVGDRLVFRNTLAAGMFFSGGGGGPSNLQDAYNNGTTITTTSGNPFTVQGPPGKIARFLGDIEVDGVVDPTGITLTEQGSNPLPPNTNGLWVNSDGDLMHTRDGMPDINITQVVSNGGLAAALTAPLTNNAGIDLMKMAPVCTDITGGVTTVDVSSEADAMSVVGVVFDTGIVAGQKGAIITSGRLEDITTSASYKDSIFISKAGDLTNVKPSIGTGGFVAGDWVIRIGVIVQNPDDPMKKDLLVNVGIIGQL